MGQLRVGLYTLGCKVSQYETEAIAEEFVRQGFILCSYEDVCDVYVINTCTVTAEADRKSRQCIRRAISRNPLACVMVTGCYSQTTAQDIAKIGGVWHISGTYGKMKLAERAKELLAAPPDAPVIEVTSLQDAPFEKMHICHSPRTRAYVKIEDGCECRCTYCTIPNARGPVRSKLPLDVLQEVKGLTEGGTREVVLTGIETASYGVDLEGYRLIDLLEELDREGYADRIRLGSLTPEAVTEDFANRLGKLKSITPHFHLSMQSGSDRVLAMMKRRYNTRQALAAMERLRRVMPNVQFTTDLMVGFPGETEEMFLETLDFVKKARFLSMHVFAYSRRRGTPADTYEGQIDGATKARRSRILTTLGTSIRDEILDGVVARGEPVRLLLETKVGDTWTGHTDEFIDGCVTGLPSSARQGDLIEGIPTGHQNGVLEVKL